MTTDRLSLLQRYADGEDALRAALDGITEVELDARPGPEAWTAREVVHHLADSEMTSAIRLRRLVAEEAPAIDAYDEGAFARRLHYERPVEASLDAAVAARRASAQLLQVLTDEEWDRSGTHPDHGTYSIDLWLQTYTDHAIDHAEQIRQARRAAT